MKDPNWCVKRWDSEICMRGITPANVANALDGGLRRLVDSE